MSAGEGRRGTEGIGTGGDGKVEFTKRGDGVEEAGDEDTTRGSVIIVELRKALEEGADTEDGGDGVERGAMEGGQPAGVGRALGARGGGNGSESVNDGRWRRRGRLRGLQYSGILTAILPFTILYMVVSRVILRLSSKECQFKSFRRFVTVPGSRT